MWLASSWSPTSGFLPEVMSAGLAFICLKVDPWSLQIWNLPVAFNECVNFSGQDTPTIQWNPSFVFRVGNGGGRDRLRLACTSSLHGLVLHMEDVLQNQLWLLLRRNAKHCGDEMRSWQALLNNLWSHQRQANREDGYCVPGWKRVTH